MIKIVSEYDQEIPQSQTSGQHRGFVKKSHTTNIGHQEDKQSKANSSLFPILIEWTVRIQRIYIHFKIENIALKYVYNSC